jgi:hypothetical protein
MTRDPSKRRQILASLGGAGIGLLLTAHHARAEEDKDGFDQALEKIALVEAEFGLADLSAVTAALPSVNVAR